MLPKANDFLVLDTIPLRVLVNAASNQLRIRYPLVGVLLEPNVGEVAGPLQGERVCMEAILRFLWRVQHASEETPCEIKPLADVAGTPQGLVPRWIKIVL